MRRISFTIMILLLGMIPAEAALAKIIVVAHKKCPIDTLTKDQVRKIYLGKARTFPGGNPVVPVDQTENSPLWEEFTQKIIRKSAKQLKAYWSVKIFTGWGVPPAQMKNDKAVIDWLSTQANGLAYIDQQSQTPEIKVLLQLD